MQMFKAINKLLEIMPRSDGYTDVASNADPCRKEIETA